MAKYVQWITHKGVQILLVNAKGLPEAEYVAAFEELKQEILKGQSNAPTLSAVVGLSKLAKVVAQLLNPGTHYFDTVDEAKEWLVKEEDKRRKH